MSNKKDERADDILQMIRARQAERTIPDDKFDVRNYELNELLDFVIDPLLDNPERKDKCLAELLFEITNIQTDLGLGDEPPEWTEGGSPIYSNEQLCEASDNVHIRNELLEGFRSLERTIAKKYGRKILQGGLH